MSIDSSTHSLFGVSKASADLLVQEYGRYFGMPTVCFRGGCLTGPQHAGAELHGFLAYLMRCTVTGTPYTVFGYSGKQVRDNIHSADLVDCFMEFQRRPRAGAVYNIGGGRFSNCSMLEAIEACERISGRELNWEREPEGAGRGPPVVDLRSLGASAPTIRSGILRAGSRRSSRRCTTRTSSAGPRGLERLRLGSAGSIRTSRSGSTPRCRDQLEVGRGNALFVLGSCFHAASGSMSFGSPSATTVPRQKRFGCRDSIGPRYRSGFWAIVPISPGAHGTVEVAAEARLHRGGLARARLGEVELAPPVGDHPARSARMVPPGPAPS